MFAVLIFFSAVVLMAGFSVHHWISTNRKRTHDRRFLTNAPRVPIGAFSSGAKGKIVGRVHVVDGTVVSPLLNKVCVAYRLEVEEFIDAGADGAGRWVTIVDEVDGRSFMVADETGHAWVRPAAPRLAIHFEAEVRQDIFQDLPPAVEQLLRRRGIDKKGGMGILNRKLAVREGVFEPGEMVAVYGHGRRDPSGGDLVFVGGRMEHDRLIVSDVREALAS